MICSGDAERHGVSRCRQNIHTAQLRQCTNSRQRHGRAMKVTETFSSHCTDGRTPMPPADSNVSYSCRCDGITHGPASTGQRLQLSLADILKNRIYLQASRGINNAARRAVTVSWQSASSLVSWPASGCSGELRHPSQKLCRYTKKSEEAVSSAEGIILRNPERGA